MSLNVSSRLIQGHLRRQDIWDLAAAATSSMQETTKMIHPVGYIFLLFIFWVFISNSMATQYIHEALLTAVKLLTLIKYPILDTLAWSTFL